MAKVSSSTNGSKCPPPPTTTIKTTVGARARSFWAEIWSRGGFWQQMEPEFKEGGGVPFHWKQTPTPPHPTRHWCHSVERCEKWSFARRLIGRGARPMGACVRAETIARCRVKVIFGGIRLSCYFCQRESCGEGHDRRRPDFSFQQLASDKCFYAPPHPLLVQCVCPLTALEEFTITAGEALFVFWRCT